MVRSSSTEVLLLLVLGATVNASFGASQVDPAALAADDVYSAEGGCAFNALQHSKGHVESLRKAELAQEVKGGQFPGLDDVLGKLTDAVSNVTDSVKDAVSDASESLNATDIVNSAAAQARETLANVTGKALEAIGGVNGTVNKMAKDLGIDVPPVVKSATDSFEDLEDKVNQQAYEISSRALDMAAQADDPKVRQKILDQISAVNQTVQGGIVQVDDAIEKAEDEVATKLSKKMEGFPPAVAREVEQVVTGVTSRDLDGESGGTSKQDKSSSQSASSLGLLSMALLASSL
mmetsp:Transcript_47173/g.76437  ORF Transcript_47173/g.76437 Transcript_47173/m.76437 type:complete len:291 (+) Transcript_47173:86-958(+)